MPPCTLCDLPTGDDPHTAPDVDGEFCCRGCLAVARSLGDAEGLDGLDEVEERRPDAEPDDDFEGDDVPPTSMGCTVRPASHS